ncbi:ferredoxin-thioredoxin reductase catalytic domain-containing protein [Selenihalanaerobacter shriftii]|uniref:ferredoxin:thioredoxin reductase n=1 Tax=Selenihalanaerobacter shriftii TaxID=142842 RepID=A0A1T4LFP4_9FIRM|nr:ferredoxin-thioredoxin reductase catalytic domain-containing protein [Selenihalanaerobacter shriftii]SJZ53503.1 Ferredoxin-thioredoxin reductase, catalytic subunit [Selenihalanaerobacter shriftii]
MEDVNKDEVKKARKFVEGYAKKNGYKLNPNEEVLNTVIEGLARNKVEHGYQYCPCRLLTGDKEVDKDKICPCKWHKEEIEEDGQCHCQLFFKNK